MPDTRALGRVLLITVLMQACGHAATQAPAPRSQAETPEPGRIEPNTTSTQATDDAPAEPANHGTVVATRKGSNLEIHVVGDFAAVDTAAITATVRRACAQPILSIVRRPESVEVMTGAVCGDLCGSGDMFLLRKVNGTWTIVEHRKWVS
jgi:hypothetical protein